MRIVNHVQTLHYYDGPEVILAEDQLGSRYVCSLVSDSGEDWEFLCVPASDGRIDAFRAGDVDLRDVLSQPETKEYFVTRAPSGKMTGMELELVNEGQVHPDWLPDAGFFLELIGRERDTIEEEAQERNRAVIHWRLKPPEAELSTKIAAATLSEALRIFQRLVRHAYRKSIRTLDASTRANIDIARGQDLEVFSFSPGSFTVHMQSTLPADLFGKTEMSRALSMIDSVSEFADDADKAVGQLSQIGGHFASAYKGLLLFVQKNESPFEYEWAEPGMPEAKRFGITSAQAKPLYEEITKRKELEKEVILLLGSFNKIDEKTRTWRIVSSDDNKEYSGESEVDLAGITISTQTYRLRCEERLEEEVGTGREIPRLILQLVEPLD